MTKKILLTLLMLVISSTAYADATLVEKYMNDPAPVGQKARLTYMLWDVYDATLYAPAGQWRADKPYALSLSYLRPLKGKLIAERSIKEIKGQGFSDAAALEKWEKEMKRIFPDVDKSVTLTGIRDKNGYAVFYQNGTPIGTVKDTEFANQFFGIWLNEKTSEPKMRKKIMGLGS